MNLLWRTGQYLRYRWRARGRHGVHSPFVYALADRVLPHHRSIVGKKIEQLRRQLLGSQTLIAIEDCGEGSAGDGQHALTLGRVVRSTAPSQRSGELLQRLCTHLNPQQALELGTNLGFSTLYQCAGLAPTAQLITVECSAALASLAQQHLQRMGCTQAQVWHSTFDAALTNTHLDKLDYVLLNGQQTNSDCVRYFAALLPKLQPGALFILDAIYSSSDKANAWRQLCAHPAVSLSIDLFYMGLLFVHRPQAREHFVLKV